MSIRYFLLPITLAVHTLLYAQIRDNAWVITQQGDTLRGSIAAQLDRSEGVLIRLVGADAPSKFSPTDIRAFFADDLGYYRSVAVPARDGQRLFLRCLAEGKLILYAYQGFFYAEKAGVPDLIALKKNDRLYGSAVEEDRRYVNILQYLSRDCPEVQKQAPAVVFNEAGLTQFAANYNRCVGGILPDRAGGGADLSRYAGFGARLGAGATSVLFPSQETRFYGRDLRARVRYTFGAFYRFPLTKRLGLQPELLLARQVAQYEGRPNTVQVRIDYAVTYLQAPLLFYYYFMPDRGWTPFLSAGGYAGFVLKKRFELTDIANSYPIFLADIDPGFRLGAGIRLPSPGSGWQPGIEYQFSQSGGVSGSDDGIVFRSHFLGLRIDF
jgi:hypothetical protein